MFPFWNSNEICLKVFMNSKDNCIFHVAMRIKRNDTLAEVSETRRWYDIKILDALLVLEKLVGNAKIIFYVPRRIYYIRIPSRTRVIIRGLRQSNGSCLYVSWVAHFALRSLFKVLSSGLCNHIPPKKICTLCRKSLN